MKSGYWQIQIAEKDRYKTKKYDKYESKSEPKKPYKTFKKKKYVGETSKNASKGKKGAVPTCYKCGKVGHYKSECKMKDKISNLSISEELKQQLCQIMLNSSDFEQESDNELAQLENEGLFESDTKTSSDSEDECACQFNDLKICVLTKEESLIIDLIDKIEDPEKKREALESYISLAKVGPSNLQPAVTNVRQPVENYSFKTIVNRMNDKIHKKEPTLNDLQCEVHDVKEELREIKNRVRILELYRPFSEKDTEEKSEQLEFENLMEEFQEKIELVRKESLQEEQVNTMKFVNSIDRVIALKWDKQQLQRFLGSLNYIKHFYKDLAQDSKLLYQRLKKNPVSWSDEHTKAVRRLKVKVKELPCLALANPEAFKIVETDASEIGYGGILKQRVNNSEQLVRFTSGVWKPAQKNYSTVKKEMLAIVHAVSKFESDLFNKKFLIRVDCKAAKDILFKDVKNLASKQIFERWQGILSAFDFDIEFIKGETNALLDFLPREFLQGAN
ncbi:uncharacterized protein LOC18776948 [Prunus persica]|uniref:uncharacterized protein LOC18776948 n=1 Tax=Prunus persica TaxID=3760 RepID=UPI0009AB576B|nr:uncharacterized protein LOC18776948 [Prunus persica]